MTLLNTILHPRREKSRKKEKKAEKARKARVTDPTSQGSGNQQRHPSQHPDSHKERDEARARKEENRKRQAEEVETRKMELEEAVRTDPAGVRYGVLEHSGKARTAEEEGGKREDLSSVDYANRIGDAIVFKARIHRVRQVGGKLAFIILRSQTDTVQAVIKAEGGGARRQPESSSAISSQQPRTMDQQPYSSPQDYPQAQTQTFSSPAQSDRPSSGYVPSPTSSSSNLTGVVLGDPIDPSVPIEESSLTLDSINLNPTHQPFYQPSYQSTSNNFPSHISTPMDSQARTPETYPSPSPNTEFSSPEPSNTSHGRRSQDELPSVSEAMVRWLSKLRPETLVLVQAVVRKPAKELVSVDVKVAELELLKVHVISSVTAPLAFVPADFDKPQQRIDKNRPAVTLQEQVRHRPLAIRTPESIAIFRIQAMVCRAARSFLEPRGFIELHSAKLQAAATESGASVFKLDYFGRTGCLAQSPQLAKEIAVSAFERVYEIGPVFRAENSNTHRHMMEYTGVDVEMAIDLHYHEGMYMIDGMLKHIFRTILEDNRKEIDIIKEHFPHDDIVFPDETLVLNFRDGVKMLIESGWTEDPPDMDDLSTRAEVELGRLVKEKYGTDYYILDKFPAAARPFYTMPAPEDPELSNSFDIFIRGEEILSGGQRLHDANVLREQLQKAHIPAPQMKEYLEAFEAGQHPHAGGGIGLERVVMLMLKLGNIRYASLFPRDPKSLPRLPPNEQEEVARVAIKSLPAPSSIEGYNEPDALCKDPMKKESHPDLLDLIADYGESTNTAYTDEGYEIWREESTGWALGYVYAKSHIIAWGVPLSPISDASRVIKGFVDFCNDDIKISNIIWVNIDQRTQQTLTQQLKWTALAVTAEQRINPQDVTKVQGTTHISKKLKAAANAGLTCEMLPDGEPMPTKLREELEEGMRKWQQARQSREHQIHTTTLRTFTDCRHRSYLIARDSNHKACGFLVIHRLNPTAQAQIKWSLQFPDSPNGTSELLVTTAMSELNGVGITSATFGAGARRNIEAVAGIGDAKSKILERVYETIQKTFKLANKTDYRKQFGAEDEPLYLAYPGNIGPTGVRAIIEAMETDD